MKTLLHLTLLFGILISCEKSEDRQLPEINKQFLQKLIEDRKVDALEMCCSDCPCDQEMGVGKDYSFPADSIVRIYKVDYEIDRIVKYRVENLQDGWHKEVRLILLME